MRVIKRITTDDTILTSSNITENEYPTWTSAGSYTALSYRIYNHKIYQAISTHSGRTTTPDLDTTYWLDTGYTNRYRMFDNVISNKSSRIGGIQFTLTPSQVVDAIAFLDVNAASVRVVMTDPSFGVVYDQTELLTGVDSIVDYYSYFFSALGAQKLTAIFTDLPTYPTATITVYIDSGTALAEVGEVVYGQQTIIGRTNYGTQIGIKSFSRKDVDEFGNVTVVKRKNSKFAEYDIDIDNYRLAEIQRLFQDLDSVPSVFVGNPEMEELVVYGFYNDFQATIALPTVSKCTLRVEGLI